MTENAIHVLFQLNNLLFKLQKEEYSQELPLMKGASIGKHTRHIVEFFQCLITQLPTGTINYDIRKRNEEIEIDNTIAINSIEEVISQLKDLEKNDLPLELVTGEGMVTPFAMTTSLNREIWYNIEHAIHHMAIIRIAVSSNYSHILIPEEFGVAYSTLNFISTTGNAN